MWFKKKKEPRLPKDLSNLPPDARRAAEQLFAQQLADKALNHRNLKQYDESLKWSEMAYKEYNYKPAISIHGNTLVLAGRPDDALKWFREAFDDHSKNPPELILIEILANIIWLTRDHAKNEKQAEDYLAVARKAEKLFSPTKDLAILSSGLDVEEAILLSNRGEVAEAIELAKRRLLHVPSCPRAKLVLSAAQNVQSGTLKYYGMIRSADGAIALDQSASDIIIRLYRGLEEMHVSAVTLSMVFLGARTKGWNADFLFSLNKEGDEAFMRSSTPIRISNELAVELHGLIAPLSEHEEIKDVVSFVADGSFIVEELT